MRGQRHPAFAVGEWQPPIRFAGKTDTGLESTDLPAVELVATTVKCQYLLPVGEF
jgi:hypothetical protein